MTLFDPQDPQVQLRHDAPATSEEAAGLVLPATGSQRLRVLYAIAAAYEAGDGGLTDEELADQLAMGPNTERPRRRELVMGGWLVASALRRPTGSGAPSTVWILTDAAKGALRLAPVTTPAHAASGGTGC